MREIKFRAWNFKMKKMFSAGEMAKDQLALLPTGNFINCNDIMELSIIYPTETMLPMQYTGLKDKNGKEIYEGDILTQEGEPNFIVQYSDGSFRGDDIDGWDVMSDHFPLDQSMTDTAEVIGNIYESDVDKLLK